MTQKAHHYLKADAAVTVAKVRRARAFRRAFPVGSFVTWVHNGHGQRGTVLEHDDGTRLKAGNVATGRVVWVSAYTIPEISASALRRALRSRIKWGGA